MLAVSTPALAQKKEEQEEKIARLFDITLQRLGKVDLQKSNEVRKVTALPASRQELFDSKLSQLDNQAEATRKQVESKKASYITNPSSKQQIDKDLLPLIAAIPEPISSLPQAKQEIKMSTDDNVYTRYIEKVKHFRDGLAERARQEMMANQKDITQMKNEALQNSKKTDEMLAANPMIQEMGGMEKLKNMTPEQRAALGKQMAEKLKQNPGAYTTQPKTVTQASRDADLAKRDKVAASMAIDKRLSLIMEHSKELAAIAGAFQQQTDAYFEALYKKTSDEYGARVAALPVVELGEAGHGKITRPVDVAYNIVLYPQEQQHALSNKQVWMRFLEVMKVSVAEYNELLSDFSDNSRLLAEKGLTPAGLSAGLCDDLIRMAQMAKLQSGQNASWQRTYDEKVLQIYE